MGWNLFAEIKCIRKINWMKCIAIYLLVLSTICVMRIYEEGTAADFHFTKYFRISSLFLSPPKDFFGPRLQLKEAPKALVHLDLRKVPLNMKYIIKFIIPAIIRAGGNGILIEYGDKFPYEGELKNITAPDSYSKSELAELVEFCSDKRLEVMPLIPLFGQMDYVLKLEEFKHLREHPKDSSVICPVETGSTALMEEMLSQVVSVHKYSPRVHIGCRNYRLNWACKRCSKLAHHDEDAVNFITYQIYSISKRLNLYHGVIAVVWDDLYRELPLHRLNYVSTLFKNYVEVMISDYHTNHFFSTPSFQTIQNYFNTFSNIWVSGEFKGSRNDGKLMVPNMKNRFINHNALLRTLQYVPESKLEGYVLTGKSYFDNDTLAEFFPLSIPSLMLNLLMVKKASVDNFDIASAYKDLLNCETNDTLTLENIIYDKTMDHIRFCTFPGSELIVRAPRLHSLKPEVDSLYRYLKINLTMYDTNSEKHFEEYITDLKLLVEDYHNKAFISKYYQWMNETEDFEIELRRYFVGDTAEKVFEKDINRYSNKMLQLKENLDNAAVTVREKIKGTTLDEITNNYMKTYMRVP